MAAEDSGSVSVCIDIRINTNAPGFIGTFVITATGGSAEPGILYAW